MPTLPRLRSRPRLNLYASFPALQVPSYRRFLIAQLVGSTGVWVQRLAQDWLILELTGSAAAVGLVVMLQFAPMLLFGLYGGVIVDRFPRRRLLMITQATAAALSVLLGVLCLTGVVQAWMVCLVAISLGMVTVVDQPCRQAFVSELVGVQYLRSAVGVNSSVFQFSGLLGPALSGLLIHSVGQGWSFLINGLACSLVVTVLSTVRPQHVKAPAARAKGQLVGGLRYIRDTPVVAWTIAFVAVAGLLGFNMPVLLSAFADRDFATGVAGYSLFTSVQAVGALIGAVAAARRSERSRIRNLSWSLLALGGCSLALTVTHHYLAFCALLIVHGALAMTFLIGANTLVQLTTATQIRGRVMSVYTMMLFGGQAIASPLLGQLTDASGPRGAMLVCGVGIIATVIAIDVLIGRQAHLTLRLDRRRPTPRIRIVPRPAG